jgi:hypothetical protein
MGAKAGPTTTATQTSAPPAWARPALEKAGQEAMRLFDSGQGFNTYTGPTRAGMSDPRLAGMNALLAATGYQGPPVSNQTVQGMVHDVNSIMQAKLANKPQPAPVAPPMGTKLWGS